MKILVVSPHPDDLEIGCAGTLLRFAREGAQIISVVTVRPSGEVNPKRSKEIVEAEMRASYEMSGFELRVYCTDLFGNNRPNLVCNNVTMYELGQLLEPCDICILPNPQDWHQDHVTTYNLAYPLMRNKCNELWLMESWPYCKAYENNTSNMFVDISETMVAKLSLLECYGSWVGPEEQDNLMKYNEWCGQRADVEYAEAFTVKYRRI